MKKTKEIEAAEHEREQVRRANAAMRIELERANARADVVLERLRAKVAAKVAPLRLVKSR